MSSSKSCDRHRTANRIHASFLWHMNLSRLSGVWDMFALRTMTSLLKSTIFLLYCSWCCHIFFYIFVNLRSLAGMLLPGSNVSQTTKCRIIHSVRSMIWGECVCHALRFTVSGASIHHRLSLTDSGVHEKSILYAYLKYKSYFNVGHGSANENYLQNTSKKWETMKKWQ